MPLNGESPNALTRVGGNAAVAALLVSVFISFLGGFFGTADIEESANTSYSAGADYSTTEVLDREIGTHTVLGVPVYDTLQGTGDRLPYQASWGQSATWWLRLLVNWEHYSLLRTFLFALPALYLCILTLKSWLPQLSTLKLSLFGVLCSSSYGLLLRQNEWSDHYVQLIGVTAVAMFSMHRQFHDKRSSSWENSHCSIVFCLALALNGVVTGHPGFWPIAFAIWASVLGVFATSRLFRSRFLSWVNRGRSPIVVTLVVTFIILATVLQDLTAELAGQLFGGGRLERTQGLFSGYAFSGVYGLSAGGFLPPAIKAAAASIFGTTVMPLFLLFDGVLPENFRASDFREMPRVEFTASLILFAVFLGWKTLRNSSVRTMLPRLLVAQVLIWMFVAGWSTDSLPATVATSGAWMTLAIVLTFNVFVGWVVLGHLPRQNRAPRLVALLNLGLVAVWCLVQFGFVSFGSLPRFPERHASWLRAAEVVEKSDWLRKERAEGGRVVIVQSASFYDFLPFVSLGIPTVATADPKIRASGQLQGSFAFNYSINPASFGDLDGTQIERTLDFLQIRSVLVGNPIVDKVSASGGSPEVIRQLGDLASQEWRLDLPNAVIDVYERSGFSASVMPRKALSGLEICPILQQSCAVMANTSLMARSASPKLSLCSEECLWRFDAPSMAPDDALILPVTYEDALTVSNTRGERLSTSNAGGFLAVFHDAGVLETQLTISLAPDTRMISRVIASYASLCMILILGGMWIHERLRSRSMSRSR